VDMALANTTNWTAITIATRPNAQDVFVGFIVLFLS
jgi:hypothetical protein